MVETESQFQKNQFLLQAEIDCKLGSPEEFREIWNTPDIVKFFANLPDDSFTRFLGSRVVQITQEYAKVLIVGGATGRLGRHLARNYPGLSALEVDLSPLMTSEANCLARGANLTNFLSIQSDAFALPFADSSFDLVVSQGFLRHFKSQDIAPLTAEMKRVGKRIFVAEANSGQSVVNLTAEMNQTQVCEEKLKMFRVSLFLYLYKKYKNDQGFREFVDGESIDPLDYLSLVAGENDGTLYWISF